MTAAINVQDKAMPELMTRREVAKYLRVALETFRQLVKTPKLAILLQNEIRIGRQIVYPRAAVDQFLSTTMGKTAKK